MANPTSLGIRVERATKAAIAVIVQHGSEEANRRIRSGSHGGVPMPNKRPFEYAALQAELVEGLAGIIARLINEQAAASAATTETETEN